MKTRRRIHKKSKLGCVECKRRHIKCDEGRPICSGCRVSQRHCTFEPRPRSRAPPQSESLTPEQGCAAPDPEITSYSIVNPAPAPGLSEPVNLLHSELLIHYSFTVSAPEFDPDLERMATKLILKHALAYPWLLYQVLAISARHLAWYRRQTPDASAIYHAHASNLQTQALTLLNAETLSINAANCSAVVFFSSILGRHLLTDTLASLKDDANLTAFLEQYDKYVQLYQGLREIIASAKDLVTRSDSWPLAMWSGFVQPERHKGHQLEPLRAWIKTSLDSADSGDYLERDAVPVYLEVIDILQGGIDDVYGLDVPLFSRCRIALSFAVLCPPTFQLFLRQRRPQALVVLAYYAVLVHDARDIWQINNTGESLFYLVADSLGRHYTEQLAWPRAALRDSGSGQRSRDVW